jgi:Uma2 family endonuclease
MSATLAPPVPPGTQTPPPARALGAPAARRWTFAEFDKLLEMDWVQPRRHQLIRGEIVDMGEQSMRHHTSVDAVVDALRAAFGPGFFVRNAGPLQFRDSKPEPDVSVLRGKRDDYLTEPPPATALLVIEVALTSLTYDLTTKAELYATAGIADYWVIDLDGRELHVFRDPQHNVALNITTYRSHTTRAATESVSPLAAPGASVAVADLLP